MSDPVEHPVIHSTFGYAAQLVILDPGSGDIERVVAAHDVGRAVNPLLCEGQIEGSVHMGLGYALSEGFPTDEDGRPTNTTLRQLAIIRPKDMPPVDVILIEAPQPNSPVRHQGRRRDRPRPHRRRRGRGDARPRRRVAQRAAACRTSPTANG
ncbi:MAG: molybdopterin cofactor-binding domain-containing protein [Ilumatobacteraceae bacterium]